MRGLFFFSQSTVSGVLNGMGDKNPTLIISKFRNKSTTPTWKKAGGHPKSTLHDVPIFTLTGSKRNNEAIMMDAADWVNGGKKVCSVPTTSGIVENLGTVAVDTQPCRPQ
jgi:hypothetical protein